MTTSRHEVGIVTNRTDLARFYERVFLLERLVTRTFPIGAIERLGMGGQCWLKIMVPAEKAAAGPQTAKFWDMCGVRYVTLWVDDLDAVAERCVREGGSVVSPPAPLRPGARNAILRDPDGNAIDVLEGEP